MIIEKHLPAVMVDLCMTAMIHSHDAFLPDWGARRWSEIIDFEQFAQIKDLANQAYEFMTKSGHFLPEVAPVQRNGVLMVWTTDEHRIVKIIIRPDEPLSYQWGKVGIDLPTYIQGDDALFQTMLELFAQYLNRSIEVIHDPISGDAFSHGCGARPEAPLAARLSRKGGTGLQTE